MIQDAPNTIVVSSESDPENKGKLKNNENDTPTSSGLELSDHSYASPTPPKKAEIALEKTVDRTQANDHNYAELSDIPTDDDIRDEINPPGGKVILSKSDQVEISLEYQCSEALIEATSKQTERMESTGINKNHSSSPKIPPESTVNNELLDATTLTFPDETTDYVNSDEQCSQDQNETAPEQKIKSNANVNRDPVRALPTAMLTDDSHKTVRGEGNLNRQILKDCIIRLTELSKAERDRWLPELAPAPAQANLENKNYVMSNSNKNIKRRYSARKRKSVDYTNQTNDNDHDSDYEPKLPPPPTTTRQ